MSIHKYNSKGRLKEHSKNILKSLQGLAEQGWYYDEECIGGEYVSVKRYYNDWYWFDHDNQKVLGKEL